ncbi:hypothetical protein BJY01DRAFT_214473 [Aspergillus pseudoustus]|uniref:Uncharacterized protein n=1 Tax=Aspergillus pseudoustus TaxID=1810923 RepID=A0ABR4JY85_9EURO
MTADAIILSDQSCWGLYRQSDVKVRIGIFLVRFLYPAGIFGSFLRFFLHFKPQQHR